jgi:E3 ubiquitin-protein ligase TRIP12
MKSLLLLLKIVRFATPDMLQSLFVDVPISTFLAALLAEKDSSTVAHAFKLCEVLMEKLPNLFNKFFIKVRTEIVPHFVLVLHI